ncbi:PLP-dependent transferase [Ramaria rubella]|nr:PLP-dependent transferase [Ramaria rubella]
MDSVLGKQLRAALDKRPALKNLQTPSTNVNDDDLFSNDYLSLSRDSSLRSDLVERLSSAPDILGSCGSRIMDGNTPRHVTLETRLRDYFRADAALIFNSGYDANLSVFGALPQRGDVVVYDELIHASVHDGMRASRAAKSLYSFRHNSVSHLRTVLEGLVDTVPGIRAGSSTVFVAFESVYSMDGDIPPLVELIETVEQIIPKRSAQIYVDEAHSTGLYGESGRGIVSLLGLDKRVDIVLHSFTKAFASTGAAVLSSPVVRSFLLNFARPFLYTTSMSPISLISIEASLDMVEGKVGDERRKRLFSLVKSSKSMLEKTFSSIPTAVLRLAPLPLDGLESPIIPILTPHATWLCWELRKRGWPAVPVLPPTVPEGEERIRLIVHAGNTEKQLEDFALAIRDCILEGDQKRQLDYGTVIDEKPEEGVVNGLEPSQA